MNIEEINKQKEYHKNELKKLNKIIKQERDREYIYNKVHCNICNRDIFKYALEKHNMSKFHKNLEYKL